MLVEWSDPRAVVLRAAMDLELAARYADAYDADTRARHERDFALDPATIVATVLVLDETGEALGHAALRTLGAELEVKRVFVDARVRGTGASRALMTELERIAAERGAQRLVLQTGDRQPDAVALYERIGYTRIAVFAPYTEFALSRCYAKPVAGVAA